MSTLKTLLPTRYLTEDHKKLASWRSLYDAIGETLDTLKVRADEIEDLVDPQLVPEFLLPLFTQRFGIPVQQAFFSSEGELRRQIREFKFWREVVGTKKALQILLYSNGYNSVIYSLYTGDYSNYWAFVRAPVDDNTLFVQLYSDTGLFSDDDYSSDVKYPTAHFDIDILMDQVRRLSVIITGTASETFDITLGVDDQLKINIDGTTEETVTLDAGTGMSADSVAYDIQAKVNTAYGTDVIFCQNDGAGRIQIITRSFGDNSEIEIVFVSNNCYTELGLTIASTINRALFDGAIFKTLKDLIRPNVIPAYTYPHYHTNLDANCIEDGVLTNDTVTGIKCLVHGTNWVDSDTAAPGYEDFMETISYFKLGRSNNAELPEYTPDGTETDLDDTVGVKQYDLEYYEVTEGSDMFLIIDCHVDEAFGDGEDLNELAVFDGSDNLLAIATFPPIRKNTEFNGWFTFKVKYD